MSSCLSDPMLEENDTTAICLLDESYELSFAIRAAWVSGSQGLHLAYAAGSRGDFLQALQQLGADPKICRLRSRRNTRRSMRVHVSCSRDHWLEVFGEPECVEEIVVPSAKHVLHRWKHFCSDGSVACMGHLFEQSPDVHWVVVMRIMCL